MRFKLIANLLGRILLVEAGLLLLPLGVALIYGEESYKAFLITIAIILPLGLIFGLRTPKDSTLYARDGFTAVALCWIVLSFFGCLPFYISGQIPNLIDAFFEMVSGFTTTGSTILTDVEAMDQGMLFWRSFSHWVGGMGVLVFMMVVLPMSDGHGMHLLRAEMPGHAPGKLVSRMSDTSRILYGIYFVMTVVEIVMLCAGGMPLFDSCIHSFGSAGTGGFSNKALSVGYYDNPYFDVVISVFMLLFGVNFNLYFYLLIGRVHDAVCSEELRTYFGIVGVSVLAVAANIYKLYGSVWQALRHSLFQVSTIITTTGYATTDFNEWPSFSKAVLVMLMFFGACAGSTAGGFKISRLVIAAKSFAAELRRMLHPNAVSTVRFEGKPLDRKLVQSVQLYLTIYVAIFSASVLLLSLDGYDLVSTFTAVASCFNNIGPGLGICGPMGSFAPFSQAGKLLLSFDMLAGRLEIYPMLLLFAPYHRRAVKK